MKYETAGTYELTYKAVDECGNETTKARKVTVTAVTKKTVLFNDGTLIINELSTDRERNIGSHGAVVKEYAPLDENNNYAFSGTSQRPWANEWQRIDSLEFGSLVAPTSIAFWFQTTSLRKINWDNFDGSNVTTARAFVAGTNITDIYLPRMPKLTSLQYFANKCESLTSVDFSDVDSALVTNTQDAFQGCYELESVSLTGLSGTITACDRTFANAQGDGKGNMKLAAIYATSNLTFSGGSNMFRSCTSLVGGNGTAFNSSYVDSTYARCDCSCQEGYFTCDDCNDICGVVIYDDYFASEDYFGGGDTIYLTLAAITDDLMQGSIAILTFSDLMYDSSPPLPFDPQSQSVLSGTFDLHSWYDAVFELLENGISSPYQLSVRPGQLRIAPISSSPHISGHVKVEIVEG